MKKNLIITGASLAVRVAGAFVQLVMSWLIVKLYGSEAIGPFLLGLMGATGFAIIIKQGVDVALVQYFPGNNFNSVEKRSIVLFFLKELMLRSVAIILLVAVVWILTAGENGIWLMLLSMAGIAANIFLSEFLKAEGKVILSGILQFLLAPTIATSIYGVIFLALGQTGYLKEKLYEAELIWLLVWTALLAIEIGVFFAGDPCTKIKDDLQVHITHLKRMGQKIMKVNLIGFAIGWADIALSSIVFERMLSSIYGVANKLAMTGTFLAIAVTSVFGRKLSYYYEQHDLAKFRKTYRESQAVSAILGIPIVLIFFTCSEKILGIWGDEFIIGKWILVLMVISQNLLIIFGPSNYSLLMINKADVLCRIYAYGLSVMILACFVLEHFSVFGIYSVVLSTLTGNIIINLASYFYMKAKVL